MSMKQIAVIGLLALGLVGCQDDTPVAVATPQTPEQIACTQDWHKCTTNAQVMESTKALAYAGQCKQAAMKGVSFGEPKFAKYDVPFTKWFDGDDFVKFGKIALYSGDVQIQNGYGAWQNVTLLCELDLNSMKMRVSSFAR